MGLNPAPRKARRLRLRILRKSQRLKMPKRIRSLKRSKSRMVMMVMAGRRLLLKFRKVTMNKVNK